MSNFVYFCPSATAFWCTVRKLLLWRKGSPLLEIAIIRQFGGPIAGCPLIGAILIKLPPEPSPFDNSPFS